MANLNRRAMVRKVKRDLTRTMNQLFAGRKPTVEQAETALKSVLRTYPLPASIGVRLNQVQAADGQVTLVIDVFDPGLEQANAALRQMSGVPVVLDRSRAEGMSTALARQDAARQLLATMTPEQAVRMGRQLGRTNQMTRLMKDAAGITDDE